MSNSSETLFEAFLNQHDVEAWSGIVRALLPAIHEVDKNATQIWFAFYPLALARALQQSDNPEKLAKKLLLQGKYQLKDQIDSSHEFLYGHRYWAEIKKAVIEQATSTKAPASLELSTQIRETAARVAKQLNLDQSLLTGIAAVAFMTLQQVGMAAFKQSPGTIKLDKRVIKKSPEQILAARAKDDSQGIMGVLRTVDKRYTVCFDENKDDARYKIINSQDLAMASANDKRNYKANDERCIEGPIPVECRAGSCGTCWVGVLGGAEKLGEVGGREDVKIKEFGYIDTNDPKPLIRLACLAPSFGAVSIVIPPWNGVFGKYLKSLQSPAAETEKIKR